MTHFKRSFPICLIAILLSLFSSCEKDEVIDSLDEAEVAEIMETSLEGGSGGSSSNFADIVEQLMTAIDSGQLCDSVYTDTVLSNYQGIQLNASYNSDITYSLICNPLGLPQSASFSISTDSEYNTPRIESEDTASFIGTATGLQPNSPTITLNGNYNKIGSQEINVRKQRTLSSTLTFTFTNIVIGKQNSNILSGGGTFNFSGNTTEDSFNYSGSIVFNGGNNATLVVGSTSHSLDWN